MSVRELVIGFLLGLAATAVAQDTDESCPPCPCLPAYPAAVAEYTDVGPEPVVITNMTIPMESEIRVIELEKLLLEIEQAEAARKIGPTP